MVNGRRRASSLGENFGRLASGSRDDGHHGDHDDQGRTITTTTTTIECNGEEKEKNGEE